MVPTAINDEMVNTDVNLGRPGDTNTVCPILFVFAHNKPSDGRAAPWLCAGDTPPAATVTARDSLSEDLQGSLRGAYVYVKEPVPG